MISRSRIFLLSLFLIAGCSSSDPGIVLTLGAVHHLTADADGNIDAKGTGVARTFTTNLGYEVTLDTAFVVYSKVELHDCASARLFPKLLRWLSPIGIAEAHSEGSSTILGVPSVDDLMHQDLEFLKLGEIEPPAGNYCHAMVTFAPADEDAQYLPTTTDMVGKTFFISGQWVPPGGGAATAFTAESAEEGTAEIHFHDENDQETELALSTENKEETVTIGLKYDKLFEDVDFGSAPSADQIATQARTNLQNAIHQHTGSYTMPAN